MAQPPTVPGEPPSVNTDQDQMQPLIETAKQPDDDPSVYMSACIAVYGLFLLTIGILLVGDWSIRGNTEDEFMIGEGYLVLLMTVSVVWLIYTRYENYRAITERKGNDPNPEELGAVHETSETGATALIYSLGLFAIGSLVLDGFQLVTDIINNCRWVVAYLCSALKPVLITLQLCFIYRARWKVSFHKSTRTGCMLMHIVVTNIILYMWTFFKSKAALLTDSEWNPESRNQQPLNTVNCTYIRAHNTTTTYMHDIKPWIDLKNPCAPGAYAVALPWLYPFFLEFSLTASAMVTELWLHCLHKKEKHGVMATRTTRSAIKIQGVDMFGILIVGSHVGILGAVIKEDSNTTAAGLWYAMQIANSLLIIVFSIGGLYLLRSR
jgi:hypothetical protein